MSLDSHDHEVTLPFPLSKETHLSVLRERLKDTHVVDKEWRSRTASLTRYVATDAATTPPLLVKQPLDWTESEARTTYMSLQACRFHTSLTGEMHFVARPFSWGSDPPYVCMEWIEGTRLKELINASAKEMGPSSDDWLLSLATSVGGVLSRYHAAFEEQVRSINESPVDQGPGGGARRFAQKLAGSSGTTLLPVRTLGDSGPHNMIVDSERGIWLIDLPAKFSIRAAESDIARVVLRIARTYERAVAQASGRYPKALDTSLLEAIVASYTEAATRASAGLARPLLHSHISSQSFVKAAAQFRQMPPDLVGAGREIHRGFAAGLRASRAT